MTNEQLLTLASTGDVAAGDQALAQFRGLAYSIAIGFYLPGGDRDDVKQEALIGVWNAIRSWDADRGSVASTFVALCVHRHLTSCLKRSLTLRSEPLTLAVRVVRREDGEIGEAVEMFEQPGGDPADLAVLRERIAELADDLRVQLSPLEARCVLLHANGLDYPAICVRLSLSYKTVDRALTRARWKLRWSGPPSGKQMRVLDPVTVPCGSCGRRTRASTGRVRRPLVCSVCSLRAAA